MTNNYTKSFDRLIEDLRLDDIRLAQNSEEYVFESLGDDGRWIPVSSFNSLDEVEAGCRMVRCLLPKLVDKIVEKMKIQNY